MYVMDMKTRLDTQIDVHMHAYELKHECGFAHISMQTPTLPVSLFYHIIMAGRGSLALYCSPKATCNVSRWRK